MPILSTLVTAIKAAGLVDTLSSKGPLTVFAPTNDAFAAVPGLDAILKDKAGLTAIVLRHVAVGQLIEAGGLENGLRVGDLAFFQDKGGWIVVAPGSQARIVTADISATNGVAHVIDTVLLGASPPGPPAPASTGCKASGCWFYYENKAMGRCGDVDAVPSMGSGDVFTAKGFFNAALQYQSYTQTKWMDGIVLQAGRCVDKGYTYTRVDDAGKSVSWPLQSIDLCKTKCKCCLDDIEPASPQCDGLPSCSSDLGNARCNDMCSPKTNLERFVKFYYKEGGAVKNIVQLAQSTPTLSILVTALTTAGQLISKYNIARFGVFKIAPTTLT